MGIVYFDICSIPLFLIILFICYTRKMTKGTANKLFLLVVFLSLFSAIADLSMEIIDNMAPLSELGIIICNISTYIYMAIRNATNVALLLFLLALTKTTFLIRKTWVKIAFFAPYCAILVMLLQNPFTNSAFTITSEIGYARGPLMYIFYAIALLYGLVGFIYCIYCRRYLPLNKWGALLSIYVLGHIAVFIQFFYPHILVEMFCTAVGEMLIMLSIMRPEERMDTEAGMLSWTSYQKDLKNSILAREKIKITVVHLPNSRQIRNFIGDHEFNKYISSIGNVIRSMHWIHPGRVEIYYERPGTIYVVSDVDEKGADDITDTLQSDSGGHMKPYREKGVQQEPQVCIINCPDDLNKYEDIIGLGHKFYAIIKDSKVVFAKDIIGSKSFAIESHIEEILDRAIKNNSIEMYYQPIYSVKENNFHSAEALARIIDPEYGLISPAVFIPAAESLGRIIPIGDTVLDNVFRFISEHDMDSLGISFIELNLSVAQCMEKSLPDKILNLQNKYGVDPRRVSLEITETTFEDISDVVVDNVEKLTGMGYTFDLDDYGIGYSSIQRVNNIPLKLIKIDKSMLDETSSSNGRKILEHTIHMMQSIGKQIVVEGAETKEVVEYLKGINCDYIQGFYFSKPLPVDDYLSFLKDNCKSF